jgi:hypothetical protein
MDFPNLPYERLGAGFAGSFGAMLWINGTLTRKVSMLSAGFSASYFVSPEVAVHFGLALTSTTFLVGLFGMSAADWVFRAVESFRPEGFLNAFVSRWLGPRQKEGDDGAVH